MSGSAYLRVAGQTHIWSFTASFRLSTICHPFMLAAKDVSGLSPARCPASFPNKNDCRRRHAGGSVVVGSTRRGADHPSHGRRPNTGTGLHCRCARQGFRRTRVDQRGARSQRSPPARDVRRSYRRSVSDAEPNPLGMQRPRPARHLSACRRQLLSDQRAFSLCCPLPGSGSR